jgi:hemoglobin
VFARVGGNTFFDDLVERFYRRVECEAKLRRLYPDDLSSSRRSLARFLAQYWGGPDLYSQEKGHPRLRQRHAGFVIGHAERDAWFAAMRDALAEISAGAGSALTPDIEAEMLEYFDRAATWLVNS